MWTLWGPGEVCCIQWNPSNVDTLGCPLREIPLKITQTYNIATIAYIIYPLRSFKYSADGDA